MRIALVNNSKGWGGAEEMLFSLATGLRSRGHYVGLFLVEGSETIEKFIKAGFDVWAVPRKGTGLFLGIMKMIRIAGRKKFDFIHVHRNHDLLVGKIVGLFSGRLPLILTQHCRLGKTSFAAINLPDRIVSVSNYIADGIIERFPKLTGKISVVYNGLNSEDFERPRKGYWSGWDELAGKGPLLGVVGYFYKNQEELIELLPRIRSVFPDMVLIIIGRDDGKKFLLEKRAEALDVSDAVFFAGAIPHDEMKHALAGLDLNVSAFRREGFGLSVIEGMTVGTPFVGYRAGGYEEIVIQGENGFLVKNQDEFVEVLLELLSDKNRLDYLGLKAMANARQKYSTDAMLKRYESIYAELLEGDVIAR
jgi:glycosyltransferase involved in cell wall biosynthesis